MIINTFINLIFMYMYNMHIVTTYKSIRKNNYYFSELRSYYDLSFIYNKFNMCYITEIVQDTIIMVLLD